MAEKDIGYQWLQVAVGGVPYRWAIDPEQYVERDIVDFSPRSGGGDVAYANLDLYQIWTQDSWHHGLGFIQSRDKFGYRISSASAYREAGVDTRHIGMATLFTDGVGETYVSGGFRVVGGIDFKGSTYAIVGQKSNTGILFSSAQYGVYRRNNDGTWELSLLTDKCNDLFSNDQYLFAALGYDRMKKTADGVTWTDAGVGGNPPYNYEKITVHNGFFYGAETDRVATVTLTGTISFPGGAFSRGDSVEITGVGSTFTTELQIGDYIGSNYPSRYRWRVTKITDNTHATISLQTSSFFALSNASFQYRWRDTLTYLAVHFWALVDGADAEGGGVADPDAILIGPGGYHCAGMVSFNGALYVARADGVWAIDETVTPPIARRVLDYSGEASQDNFKVFIAWRGRLYFNIGNSLYSYTGSTVSNVTPPNFDLNFPPNGFGGFEAACYRGSYLFVLAQYGYPALGGCVLAFDGTGWHRLYDVTKTPWALFYSPSIDAMFVCDEGNLTRVQFQQLSELPYANFPTSNDHYLNLSEIDAGFRRVTKSFAEVAIEANNLLAPYRYVGVSYSADGGAWQTLGNATVSGVTELQMNPTVEANKLEVRLNLKTGDATQSPIVRNVAVKYMVRPNVLYGHRLTVLGADEVHMLDGRTLKASSEVQRAWLRAARNSKAPVTFVTPFGEERVGYMSTLQFGNLQRRPGESRSNFVAVTNIVEAR